jgi:hypothetical protein
MRYGSYKDAYYYLYRNRGRCRCDGLFLNGDAVSRGKRLRVYAACQSRRDHGD